MYQVLKGIRTTIAELGSNIKKRTKDLLASRQNKRQEGLNTQRDRDLENLYDRLPEFTKSKISKTAASKKMSSLDYLESNRPEFERIAKKTSHVNSRTGRNWTIPSNPTYEPQTPLQGSAPLHFNECNSFL
jgi:hypothetical protein